MNMNETQSLQTLTATLLLAKTCNIFFMHEVIETMLPSVLVELTWSYLAHQLWAFYHDAVGWCVESLLMHWMF